MLSPNGCGLSPDGKTLYAADTEGARLWAFDIEAPGVLRKPPPHVHHGGRMIAGLPGAARFDSLAVMANGNAGSDPEHRLYHRDFAGRRNSCGR